MSEFERVELVKVYGEIIKNLEAAGLYVDGSYKDDNGKVSIKISADNEPR